MLADNNNAFAKAEMLIRKPVAEVFNAFVDPEITTKCWFTKSTGMLEAGAELTWTWEMYDVSTPVKVLAIEPGKRILIEWGNRKDSTMVEWTFTSLPGDHTFVSIEQEGFKARGNDLIAMIRDSTEGFTLVLANIKAYLEYQIELGLVKDRFPAGI